MSSTETTETIHRCLSCGRRIRSAESIAAGRGKGCRAKIRRAEREADLSAWTDSQLEDAHQAITDGAVVPTTREGVFHVVSSDGTEVHLTHPNGCNCAAGMKTRQPRPCYHRAAVVIVLASTARPVHARQPFALAA